MGALTKRRPDCKHFSPTATSTGCHHRLSPGIVQEYILPSTDLLNSSLLDPLLHIFHPKSTVILLKPRTDDVASLLRILQWLFLSFILKFKNPYGEKAHKAHDLASGFLFSCLFHWSLSSGFTAVLQLPKHKMAPPGPLP